MMSPEQNTNYQIQPLVPPQAKSTAIIIILLISIIYLAVQILKFPSPDLFLDSSLTIIKVLLFIGGMIVGLLLLHFDEKIFVHRYTELVPNKIIMDAVVEEDISVDTTTNIYPQLITRSVLFLLLYIPLSLFMYTSSGSALGIGLMISIGIGLSTELWSLKNYSDAFQLRFLQQLKRQVTDIERTRATWIFIIFVTLLSAISIIQV